MKKNILKNFFKQTFLTSFKHKIQITALILLTVILSTIITLAWITSRWLNENDRALNINNSFNYNYKFNSKQYSERQTIAPTFDVCAAFGQVTKNGKVIAKTPILSIAKEENAPNGCLKPLTSRNLSVTYSKKTSANKIKIIIENIAFTNLLEWKNINKNSTEFKNSLIGQIFKKKYSNNSSEDFIKLYQAYTQVIEEYITPIFSAYLLSFYLSNTDKFQLDPINNTDEAYADTIFYFKETFLQKFVNAPLDDNIKRWERNINDENLHAVNVPLYAGSINLPNQITAEKYEKDDFDQRAFFKHGFRGDLGNIMLNINPNPSWEILKDYQTNNSYQFQKTLIAVISGGIVNQNDWNIIQKIWYHHSHLAGLLTNFTTNVRKEYLFSDFAKNIRYRIISFNNNELNIIKGVLPSGISQIMINPQFAKKHHLTIGDKIKMGNHNLLITAIGGDKFTTLPVVNALNFLPNPTKEALMFVNDALFIKNDFIRYSDVEDISNVYLSYYGTKIEQDLEWFKYFLNDNFLQSDTKKITTALENFSNNPQAPLNINENTSIILNPLIASDANNYLNRGFNSLSQIAHFYTLFNIIVIVFIILITIFATILIIRKAIERSSSQIGILKAMGCQNSTIILSYWSYAVITAIIAVPIGWIIGSVLQLAIIKIFENFFIIKSNVFYFDLWPFLISLTINFFAIIATVTITAYKEINKNTITLLSNSSNIKTSKLFSRISSKWFKFGSFQTRFKLTLASVSYKKIIMMFITMLIATFTISIALMIPATVRSLDDSYYGLLQYKTNVEFSKPISNIPTTRYSLYPWDGIDANNLDLDYPIQEIRPIADYYTTDNIFKSFTEKPEDIKIEDLSKQIAFNYYWTGGRGISLGWLEHISNVFKNNEKLSQLLSTIICPMLNSILWTNVKNDPNWRKCTMQVIESSVPSYIKDFLNLPGRKERLTITHNTLPYNKAEDELYTYYESKLSNIPFKAIGIKPNSKMLTFNEFEQHINGTSYKDDSGEQINPIPVIINRAMQIKHKLKVNSVWESKTHQKKLYYLTKKNGWQEVKQEYWVYDNNGVTDATDGDNTYTMPLDKWSLNDDTELYGWKDNYGYKKTNDDDKKIKQLYEKSTIKDKNINVKAYRNLNNLILKLPANGVNAVSDEFLTTINNLIPTNNNKNNNKHVVSKSTDNEWWKLRAFAPFGKKDQFVDKNLLNWPINLISQSEDAPLWTIFFALINSTKINNQTTPNLLKISDKVESTKYEVKGIHQSYGELRVYLNQHVANRVLDFNTTSSKQIFTNDKFNDELLWFNGRFSSNEELTDITSRYSTSSFIGDYAIASLTNNVANTIANSELLTVKKELIKNLTSIASSIAAIFILGAISLSVIIVSMISNLLVHQFARLMAIMKIQGYRHWEINSLTLSMFIPTALLGFGFGFISAWLSCKIILWGIGIFTGLIIPLYFQWWLLPISFLLVAIIYVLTYVISTETLKRMNILDLVKNKDE